MIAFINVLPILAIAVVVGIAVATAGDDAKAAVPTKIPWKKDAVQLAVQSKVYAGVRDAMELKTFAARTVYPEFSWPPQMNTPQWTVWQLIGKVAENVLATTPAGKPGQATPTLPGERPSSSTSPTHPAVVPTPAAVDLPSVRDPTSSSTPTSVRPKDLGSGPRRRGRFVQVIKGDAIVTIAREADKGSGGKPRDGSATWKNIERSKWNRERYFDPAIKDNLRPKGGISLKPRYAPYGMKGKGNAFPLLWVPDGADNLEPPPELA